MRSAALFASALAALALAAPADAQTRHAPAKTSPAPGDAAGTDAATPRSRLAGATTREVTARLGPPDVAHTEGKGAFWTYRLSDCALFVFFKDEGRGLKVSGVSAGPRRHGQAAPTAEDCLNTAEQR